MPLGQLRHIVQKIVLNLDGIRRRRENHAPFVPNFARKCRIYESLHGRSLRSTRFSQQKEVKRVKSHRFHKEHAPSGVFSGYENVPKLDSFLELGFLLKHVPGEPLLAVFDVGVFEEIERGV